MRVIRALLTCVKMSTTKKLTARHTINILVTFTYTEERVILNDLIHFRVFKIYKRAVMFEFSVYRYVKRTNAIGLKECFRRNAFVIRYSLARI